MKVKFKVKSSFQIIIYDYGKTSYETIANRVQCIRLATLPVSSLFLLVVAPLNPYTILDLDV